MTCPEREFRANLTDDEFWTYVLQRDVPVPVDGPDLDGDEPADGDPWDGYRIPPDPCDVCGERVCGYDPVSGVPYMHLPPVEVDR